MLLFAAGAHAAPPLAPTITWPEKGAVLGSNRVDVTWSGGGHDRYEVHIGSYNTPSSANGWNSGEVSVPYPGVTTVETPPLAPQQNWYVFVRLHSSEGWGPWSAAGRWFHIGGELLNDPYVVANTGLEWWSDAAYNPARNEYCMTWQNGYVIHWRRLDSTGAVLGTDSALSDGVTQGHHFSVVCYNSTRAEYLILYSGWLADDSDQMRLVRVDAVTGNQIGGTIFLDAIGTNATTGGLDIAYSPTGNSYIAVYEVYNEGNVYGRILDALGNPTGSRFPIDTPSQQYSRNPQLAWNSVNNEYLVTYMGVGTGSSWDYWAQRVSASNGALLGSNLQVTTSGNVYNYGGVAYDSDANRYLVVYDGGSSPPYGQLVSHTATLVGSAFAMGAGASTGWAAAVCYDSSKHEFVVSWSGLQTATNYSMRVSQAGVPISSAFSNTGAWGSIGIGNWPPRPVYNSVNDEFLIHWHNSYATILNRRYKSYALPAPDTTPPAPATGLTLTRYANAMGLSWTNPSTSDFAGTMIRFKTTGYPAGPTDGTLVVDAANAPSTSDHFDHMNLARGTYYYAAFAYDEVMNFADAGHAQAAILPGDFDGDTDIDQVDFGHLQACLTADGVSYTPACRDADLEGDGDVDAVDFGLFLPCMGGSDLPPGC